MEDPSPAVDHPPVEALPGADLDGPHRLDPRVVTVWQLGGLARSAFYAAGVGVALLIFDHTPSWALLVLAAGVVHALLVPPVRYRHWSYRVGPVDVRVRHGWLWRTVSVVLHSRIQHVDTRQGPLERMVGLATVVMFTAGSVGARVAIPGLEAADAEALRDRLVSLSGAGDAV